MERNTEQVLGAEERREADLLGRVRDLGEQWQKLHETLQELVSVEEPRRQLQVWERADEEARSLYLRVGEIGNVLRIAAAVDGAPVEEE